MDPGIHPHHDISLQRILIVACIITALLLTAFKPARGDVTAPRDAGGCESSAHRA
jgi:hypothetical protein